MICAGVAGAALAGMATAAQAAVEISSKPTKNMSCSAGVCSPTARKAWLNEVDLVNLLASSDVRVTTGAGATVIEVAAAFSWVSPTTLTLDSERSIVVKREITVAGPGGLTLTTNDSANTDGVLSFESKGRATFWDLTSSLVVDGNAYTLVNSVDELANAISLNASGYYALATDYVSHRIYSKSPISTEFTGTFEGLGHTIANLQISDRTIADPVGLFLNIGAVGESGGNVRNLKLTGVKLSGAAEADVGALASNVYSGKISAVSTSGSIVGGGATSTGLGGLVGGINAGVTVDRSDSTCSINGADESFIGGLIGFAAPQTTISNSSASGNISGKSAKYAGGLVGYSYATIVGSHATGAVTTDGTAGGLTARNVGQIIDSYATGPVTGRSHNHQYRYLGGLVGFNMSIITHSFAVGSVTGGRRTGGLVGHNWGSIEDSYATGNVAGGDPALVGGLVGDKEHGKINYSYATGAVVGQGDSFVGGLIGFDASPGFMTSDYWDLDTSGIGDPSRGAGNYPNDPGIVGLTDAQLKSGLPDGFDPAIWGQNANINNGYPYLLANPPPG